MSADIFGRPSRYSRALVTIAEIVLLLVIVATGMIMVDERASRSLENVDITYEEVLK